jgi:hypothetical protein
MKKLPSLVLAVISTLFLAVGALRAAGQFDALKSHRQNSSSGTVDYGPALPCMGAQNMR